MCERVPGVSRVVGASRGHLCSRHTVVCTSTHCTLIVYHQNNQHISAAVPVVSVVHPTRILLQPCTSVLVHTSTLMLASTLALCKYNRTLVHQTRIYTHIYHTHLIILFCPPFTLQCAFSKTHFVTSTHLPALQCTTCNFTTRHPTLQYHSDTTKYLYTGLLSS